MTLGDLVYLSVRREGKSAILLWILCTKIQAVPFWRRQLSFRHFAAGAAGIVEKGDRNRQRAPGMGRYTILHIIRECTDFLGLAVVVHRSACSIATRRDHAI